MKDFDRATLRARWSDIETASDNREDLGLGLKPGDPHYRAYVGPPEDYDLIAAMTFNLLTTLGSASASFVAGRGMRFPAGRAAVNSVFE